MSARKPNRRASPARAKPTRAGSDAKARAAPKKKRAATTTKATKRAATTTKRTATTKRAAHEKAGGAGRTSAAKPQRAASKEARTTRPERAPSRERAPKMGSPSPSRAHAQSDARLTSATAELEERLERAERTARAFRDVSLALGATLDLDELLELILQKITEVLEADRATLYLLDDHRSRLVSRITAGQEVQSIELPLGEGIAGHVASTGQTLRVDDAYGDQRFRREWDRITGYHTKSILAAPMKNHVGRTIGVIQVLNKVLTPCSSRPRQRRTPDDVGAFTPHDEELLTALATQAAISIDNSRLFLSVIQKNMQLVDTKEQLERRVGDLKLLFDLESAMGRETTLEGLAAAVIRETARAVDAESGALLVEDDESGLALLHVDPMRDAEGRLQVGDRPPLVRRYALKRGHGVIGQAMLQNQALSYPSAEVRALSGHTTPAAQQPKGQGGGDAGPGSRRSAPPGTFVDSAIAVPLDGDDDHAHGAMALYDSHKSGGFTQDDRGLLRLVSANVSTALKLFRSRAEREKTERLTSIGRLLSGVMHDMRTPLTVISGYVQLMAGEADARARADHQRLILKQFDLLSAMQREVLEFARGERSILVRKVYLATFFGDLERQLERELEGTGIELALELEDRTTARFDEAKLTRVLHNLARNAIEAMAPSGRGTLRIRVAKEGDDLVLSVSDTGPGIPREVQDRLFQSFVTLGKRGGTGLGLPIVKKIVDEHQGTIAVVSSGEGATFTVRIPQGPKPRPAAPGPTPSRAKALRS